MLVSVSNRSDFLFDLVDIKVSPRVRLVIVVHLNFHAVLSFTECKVFEKRHCRHCPTSQVFGSRSSLKFKAGKLVIILSCFVPATYGDDLFGYLHSPIVLKSLPFAAKS